MKPLTDEQRARRRLQAAARQAKRESELHARAIAAGYGGMSEFLTLVLRGEVELPPCPRNESKP